MKKVNDTIFWIIANALNKIAQISGYSYREINIILYYLIAPLILAALLDFKIGGHILKLSFLSLIVLLFIFVKDFKSFSNDLFDRSVHFLNSFKRVGISYITASVIVCVILPIIVLILIIVL